MVIGEVGAGNDERHLARGPSLQADLLARVYKARSTEFQTFGLHLRTPLDPQSVKISPSPPIHPYLFKDDGECEFWELGIGDKHSDSASLLINLILFLSHEQSLRLVCLIGLVAGIHGALVRRDLGHHKGGNSYVAPAPSYGAPAPSYGAPAPSYGAAPSYEPVYYEDDKVP